MATDLWLKSKTGCNSSCLGYHRLLILRCSVSDTMNRLDELTVASTGFADDGLCLKVYSLSETMAADDDSEICLL